MMMVLRIVKYEVHLLARIELLECGEETLLHPSNELLTVDRIVIIGGSNAVHANFVEDESAAMI